MRPPPTAVVFNAVSANNSLPLTASDAEDAGGASGWSIADVRYFSQDDADWRPQRSNGGTHIPAIAIRGVVPDIPAITLTVSDDTIAEGESATTVTVTATLDDGEGRADDVVVTLSLAGSADSPADYTTDELTGITITAGQTSGSTTIEFTPIGRPRSTTTPRRSSSRASRPTTRSPPPPSPSPTTTNRRKRWC